jgi:hypothetical protein
VVKKLCDLCGLKTLNRREHREHTENTEKKPCVLRGIEFKTACKYSKPLRTLWLKKYKTAENTEKKRCVLRGIEFKTACRGRSLCDLCG